MFPRWLWFNHIPAGLDLTPQQKAEVAQRVRAMGPDQRRFTPMSRRILLRIVPGTAILSLLFTIWITWFASAARQMGTPAMVTANVLGIILFQLLMWAVIAWSINRAIAPLVWRALNQVGIRVCEGCGYVLEYHPEDANTCPECGAARVDPSSPAASEPP